MATASNMIPRPPAGVVGVVDEMTLYLRLVTTTSGTLDTTNSWTPGGVTVVKTATKTGRYTVTLPTAFERLLTVNATIVGSTDAAIGANTKGLDFFIRNDNVTRTANLAGSTQAGTVDLQFVQTSYADAELPDAAAAMVTIVVARGKTF